jgi:hypothetical protein
MSVYKLNEDDMSELTIGAASINPAIKRVLKDANGVWIVQLAQGTIMLPCSISYATKEELAQKLNAIEVYLHEGWLYIDNHKYNVSVYKGLLENIEFVSFNLIFKVDEFEYEVYKFTQTTAYSDIYNPLYAYNFVGVTNPTFDDMGVIEFDPAIDNFVTGDFAIGNQEIIAAYIPEEFALTEGSTTEIFRKVDVSI